jgi:hypothetical protein
MLMETQNGLTWPFATSCGGSGCTTQINNPFGSTIIPTTALLVGLTNGGQDVVLMTNTTFGANAAGTAWNTLFPNTSESDLSAAITLATSGQDWPIITPGLNIVGTFGGGDGASAYFNIGSPFSVLEFSTGTQIGTGTSSVTSALVPSATPEPSSFILLGTGLMGFAGAIRRKFAK